MAETTIGGRLREALAERGMSLAALSEKAKLVYSSVQNYVADKQSPGAEALTKISRETGINIHWLLTGEGEMFLKEISVIPREITLSDYQGIRAKFTNFDDVFSMKAPIYFADAKERPLEIQAIGLRFALRSVFEHAKLDLAEFLQGRDLEMMSYDELLAALYDSLKLLPNLQ